MLLSRGLVHGFLILDFNSLFVKLNCPLFFS